MNSFRRLTLHRAAWRRVLTPSPQTCSKPFSPNPSAQTAPPLVSWVREFSLARVSRSGKEGLTSALRYRPRPKKAGRKDETPVVGYCTASSYDLITLRHKIEDQVRC